MLSLSILQVLNVSSCGIVDNEYCSWPPGGSRHILAIAATFLLVRFLHPMVKTVCRSLSLGSLSSLFYIFSQRFHDSPNSSLSPSARFSNRSKLQRAGVSGRCWRLPGGWSFSETRICGHHQCTRVTGTGSDSVRDTENQPALQFIAASAIWAN